MAPDSTNNSYNLEIDGGNCIVVGNTAITANTWTWVDYRDGNTGSKLDATLTGGNHTFKMIGVEPSVSIDRIVLTSDLTCVPVGTGDNCASPPDTTKPTVSLTSPANNATVSGTVNLTATASDDTAVTRVEFYINGTLAGTDTTSTYGFSWNTTSVANGAYQLTARAYDAAGNNQTSSTVNVTVNNIIPDTTLPTVNITAPLASSTISGTATFSATASDNVGVTKVEFSVDGTLKATDTTSPYTTTIDTTTLSNASHTFSVKAFDAAGNTKTASLTATVNNTTPPPTGTPGDATGDGQVTIQDLARVIANYGLASGATTAQGDVSGDGRVTIQDLAIIIANYGQ
jgi:hypothetical protein